MLRHTATGPDLTLKKIRKKEVGAHPTHTYPQFILVSSTILYVLYTKKNKIGDCVQCVLYSRAYYDTEWNRTEAVAGGVTHTAMYTNGCISTFNLLCMYTSLIHAPYTYITATEIYYIHTHTVHI